MYSSQSASASIDRKQLRAFAEFQAGHPGLDSVKAVELFVQQQQNVEPRRLASGSSRRRTISETKHSHSRPAAYATNTQNEMVRSRTQYTDSRRPRSKQRAAAAMSVSLEHHLPIPNNSHPISHQQVQRIPIHTGYMAIPERKSASNYSTSEYVTSKPMTIPTSRSSMSFPRNSFEGSSYGLFYDSTPPTGGLMTPASMSRGASSSSFSHSFDMITLHSHEEPPISAAFCDDELLLSGLGCGLDGIEAPHSQPTKTVALTQLETTPQQIPPEEYPIPSPKRKLQDRSGEVETNERPTKAANTRTTPRSTKGSPPARKPSSYVRKPHPRVHCKQCPHLTDGFRGEHELRRHHDRVHAIVKKVWIVKDLSEDKRLNKCKACKSKKQYHTDYNATAHLRRQHFNPEKDNRIKGPPPNLHDWVEMIEIVPTAADREESRQEDARIQGAPHQVPTSDNFVLQHRFINNDVVVNNMMQATADSIQAMFNGLNDESMFPLYPSADTFDPQAGLTHDSFNTQVFSSSGSSLLMNEASYMGAEDPHAIFLQQHNSFGLDYENGLEGFNMNEYLINPQAVYPA